jgi:cholesterol oxidase
VVGDGRSEGTGRDRFDYDVIVVGSGFGGSVAALRLCEKGYRVAVIEAGRRFDDASLPRTSWDVRRFLWAPGFGCSGIQRVHLLRNVLVLAGAGVGGGSLNYANTLYEPLAAFYDDPQWSGAGDWRSLLAPYFDQAKRMLGVTENPDMTPADQAMLEVATEMGAGPSFRAAPVGVLFGPPGTAPGSVVDDPYFGGAGPERRTCVQCGECMTGCRRGAKNTLTTNYLYLAESAGATVMPMTTVRSLGAVAGGGWEVGTVRTAVAGRGFLGGRQRRTLGAEHVVLAAGTYGTQQLLHSMVSLGRLPGLSSRLGHLTRTNSESVLGAVVPRRQRRPDFTRGVAITSSFYPEPGTHVEPVRYGRGSGLMGLLATLLVDGPPGTEEERPGAGRLLAAIARQPRALLRCFDLRAWSERAVIVLVMQARDNSLTVSAKRGLSAKRVPRGRVKLGSRQGHGQPNPAWLPIGHEVARRLAVQMGGEPVGTWGEVFGMPTTAHFLGGCVIGASPDEGVVDPWHRVFGCPGLHIVDGSAVPANPGANPALTITALAERAFSFWPNRGDADPRPPLGGPVVPLAQVPVVTPKRPVVPPGAPGELRLDRGVS